MKLGKLELKNVFLAPMADINDLAFRIMCKRYGASLLFTQMVNADALVRKNKSTFQLIKSCEEDSPLAVQLFGTKIDVIKKAVKIIEPHADIIDFNMGCPYKDLINIGAGAALMKRYNKVAEIVKAIRETTDKPITFKIRSGFDEKNKNALEIAKIIENNGADAIIIHPRTATQVYSGKADWNVIKELKENIKIPIIGNGDIFTPKDAEQMFTKTGCDAIMIGRASIGNPYIFKEITHYLETGKLLPEMDAKHRIEMFLEYLKLAEEYEITKFSYLKRQSMYYTKGLPNSTKIRLQLSKSQDISSIKKIYHEL